MAELITDPDRAKAELDAKEIDMDAPCTRREMATWCQNFVQSRIVPLAQQANQTAFVLNELMDFMSQRGMLKGRADGRCRMSTAEWNEFLLMRKKAFEAQKELQKKAAEVA